MTTHPFRLGLDLGSTAAKAVLINHQNNIVDHALIPLNNNPALSAQQLQSQLLTKHNLPTSTPTASTGYGRSLAQNATRQITEISCHARGIHHLHPDSKTILDIGGQDAKAIRLAPDGSVEDFAMNDRCAAGTGRFLEVAANRYGIPISQLSTTCNNTPNPENENLVVEISSTCVVFAESELISLNARGIPPTETLKAIHRSIARRVLLLLKQIKAAPPIHFTGGVAQNETLRQAIQQAANMPVITANMPQFTGALGAALLAK